MVFGGGGPYGYTRVRQGAQGGGGRVPMVPINYEKKLMHL